MRVTLELYADGDHLEGRVVPAAGGAPVPFSGVLELLHVLEQLRPGPPPLSDHEVARRSE